MCFTKDYTGITMHMTEVQLTMIMKDLWLQRFKMGVSTLGSSDRHQSVSCNWWQSVRFFWGRYQHTIRALSFIPTFVFHLVPAAFLHWTECYPASKFHYHMSCCYAAVLCAVCSYICNQNTWTVCTRIYISHSCVHCKVLNKSTNICMAFKEMNMFLSKPLFNWYYERDSPKPFLLVALPLTFSYMNMYANRGTYWPIAM